MSGPLEQGATIPVLGPALERIKVLAGQQTAVLHGFVTLRIVIQPDGRVARVQALCDRILPLSPDVNPVESFKREIESVFSNLIFPPAPGPSELTFPVLIKA